MAIKVSVLVAVYRTDPEILRQTVRSVLAQTFGDFELLLLDDCPDDPREGVVREFGDRRVVYAKNERNLGIAETRNRLMEMAKGEYLAVLDHDDICREDRLEKEVAWLDAHPDCGVVSSFALYFPRIFLSAGPVGDGAIRRGLAKCCALRHSAAMLRASVLRENGIRYEAEFSPSEDYRIFCRLAAVSKLACIPEPLLFYRVHSANTTGAQLDKMMQTAQKACDEYRAANPGIAEPVGRPTRIVVSGGWSYGNIGDDAILEATARLLWRHLPEAEVAWTAYDEDFARESGVVPVDAVSASLHRFADRGWSFWMLQTIGRSPGYALWPRLVRWFYAKLFRRRQMRRSLARDATADCSSLFHGADLYIMSGGGYFNQWPTKFSACIRELELAHENGCRVAIVGQSLGPFSDEQKAELKAALREDDFICVRDRESVAEVEAMGFRARMAPDLALGFPIRRKTRPGLLTVVPGALAPGAEEVLAGQIAAILGGCGRGWRLQIVQTCRLWPDVLAVCRLGHCLRRSGIAFETLMPRNYLELRAAIEGSEWVVSRRMHAMIIGWRSGSRVLALTKSRKIAGFLEMVGSPENICPEDDWPQLAERMAAATKRAAAGWERREELAAEVDAAFAHALARA